MVGKSHQVDSDQQDKIVIGRFNSVYGIRGWLKVFSHTDPMENLFSYKPWFIKKDGKWQTIEVINWRHHGKGIVAHLKGIDDRDVAKHLTGADIYTLRSQLPDLDANDFYWADLENLVVVTLEGQTLGRVDHLFETGSNDVLVVKPTADSVDDRERLIPYLLEQTVVRVDLSNCQLTVDWDVEF